MRTECENFQTAPKSILILYDTSFLCTKFQAFTTFSAIDDYVKMADQGRSDFLQFLPWIFAHLD